MTDINEAERLAAAARLVAMHAESYALAAARAAEIAVARIDHNRIASARRAARRAARGQEEG